MTVGWRQRSGDGGSPEAELRILKITPELPAEQVFFFFWTDFPRYRERILKYAVIGGKTKQPSS